MGEHKEVRYDRLFVKTPGTDRLRKNAAGRLRYMLSTGWREVERWQESDAIRVRLERSGHAPPVLRIPIPPPPPGRGPRQGQDQAGRGRGQGGRGPRRG